MAFKREVIEEAGYEVEKIKELGIIEEYRSKENLKQISYVFLAYVKRNLQKLNLTEQEKKEKATLLWLESEEVLKQVINSYNKLAFLDSKDIYNIQFIL